MSNDVSKFDILSMSDLVKLRRKYLGCPDLHDLVHYAMEEEDSRIGKEADLPHVRSCGFCQEDVLDIQALCAALSASLKARLSKQHKLTKVATVQKKK